MESARRLAPRSAHPLEALFRVNPIKFAADKGMAEAEAIDLFLYAAAYGLFEMNG